jgi:hypothetical protein
MYLEELGWHQFKQLNNIRKLPLNEQVQHYNRYLNDLSTQRILTQLGVAAGGDTTSVQPPPSSNCIEFVLNTTLGTNSLINFTTLGSVEYTLDWGDGTINSGTADGESINEHEYADADQSYTCLLCFDNAGLVSTLEFVGND